MTDEKKQSRKGSTRKGKPRRRGSGSVFRRPDRKGGKEWVAQIILENGKPQQRYFYTQAEADEALTEMLYEQKRGLLASGPKQKLADHLTYWLEQVKKRKVRASTYVRYRSAMEKHILPALGDLPLHKITLRTIQQFYNRKLDEGQSPSSVITMNKVLHQALAYAVKERLIAINPCVGVSLPSEERRKVQPLTFEQAQRLLQEVQGTMMEPFIVLALVLGMRHGELLALRWQDINLTQRTLAIHFTLTQDERYHYVVGDPKTASSERLILLPQPVCEMLHAHRERQAEARLKAGSAWQQHDLVFCTDKGAYLWPANVRQRFYRILQRAGLLPMHIHDLRHSASTLLRKMGVDLKVIQEILGHSTLDMTANVYSHVLPSMQQEAVEKMEEFFKKP
ncbi:MAG TPA: site-specific integrase [Ktedonobacteraceae bacterium]|nr:site-specific integrase [Ktedonobacteraceae bacterium]